MNPLLDHWSHSLEDALTAKPMERVPLAVLQRRVIHELNPMVERYRAKLKWCGLFWEHSQRKEIWGFQTPLERIFRNLAVNCNKYGREDGEFKVCAQRIQYRGTHWVAFGFTNPASCEAYQESRTAKEGMRLGLQLVLPLYLESFAGLRNRDWILLHSQVPKLRHDDSNGHARIVPITSMSLRKRLEEIGIGLDEGDDSIFAVYFAYKERVPTFA